MKSDSNELATVMEQKTNQKKLIQNQNFIKMEKNIYVRTHTHTHTDILENLTYKKKTYLFV